VCSYRELAALAGRFAALLSDRGIGKGDRVLIWAPNSAEWMGAFFGCVLRGVVPVPLDDAGTAAFTSRVAADTAPKLAAISASHARELHTSTPIIMIDQFESVLPSEPDFSVADLESTDALQIIFTSGTPGRTRSKATRGICASVQKPLESLPVFPRMPEPDG
jgi:long-chain acyl-CoA synthetase